jgi:DNA-binding transcriptional LysR family regulator
VLDGVAAARAVLEELSREPTGPLALAASQTIASYWLPHRLAAFRAAYPAVRLDVTIGNTREVEAAVVDGGVNLGLVEGPTQNSKLERRQIDQDRPLLVVAARHPPLPEKAGRLDLRAVSWVIREEGSGTRHVLEDLAEREGLTLGDLKIFLVLPVNEAVREAVESGAGATIISEHVVASSVAAGKLRAIPIDLPPRDFTLVRHRDRHLSLAQLALVRHLIGPGGVLRAGGVTFTRRLLISCRQASLICAVESQAVLWWRSWPCCCRWRGRAPSTIPCIPISRVSGRALRFRVPSVSQPMIRASRGAAANRRH